MSTPCTKIAEWAIANILYFTTYSQKHPGLNVSVSSTGISVYDNNMAKMTSGAKNYRRNKNHLEWQNRNGAPRLNVGPKSGQDNFSRNIVGDVYMAPTKIMKSTDFQPYDHRW